MLEYVTDISLCAKRELRSKNSFANTRRNLAPNPKMKKRPSYTKQHKREMARLVCGGVLKRLVTSIRCPSILMRPYSSFYLLLEVRQLLKESARERSNHPCVSRDVPPLLIPDTMLTSKRSIGWRATNTSNDSRWLHILALSSTRQIKAYKVTYNARPASNLGHSLYKA